ncbi:protein O-mannosyl-transferase family [Sunxiuqinia sp. A32]|uniref:protein O-mannosyl-transferase family n=1 Tax=Sunxiuqinia sp. A32 TaxID=3461496 RepID=UPI00404564E6
MNFNQKNNLLGWLIFVIAAAVYILTLEPTLSLWDCGEFLVSAYRLEISHAPGAPLFMLLGRVFSLLSFDNAEKAAMMVNLVSALASAATVMFLYWTLVWLLQKIEKNKTNSVFISSSIGALAFAFTDSFWFSAVEAEVYALSMLFMAVILWAATRWEKEADHSSSGRWLLLIFFFTGLSIGVHLLNLLVLPTVALIIYFRKSSFKLKSFLIVLLGSGALILFLMKIFIPGVFSLAGPLELFAVNQLGMPVNSGFYVYLVLLIALLVGLLYYTHQRKNQLLNLIVLCCVFLMLGYTSYMTSFIRSAANPPVDQGNPETTFGLIDYLNRESYGSRPILYGENYGSIVRSYRNRNTYEFDGEKYFQVKLNPKVFYDDNTTCFFPRLHSKEGEHLKAYRNWVSMKGKKVRAHDGKGETVETTIPTFTENFMFFIRYQLGHMYLRYFMWNFSGRQDDIQGYGDPLKGNWQSGISFIDEMRLGSQTELPSAMSENRARNSYYFLPFILGIIGLFYHYQKKKNTFITLLLLFGLMSVGLMVYLNEIPITPRERDYVFVGSFYIFCIWIGIGVFALIAFLSKYMPGKTALFIAGVVGFIAGPGILISQNYDDHDRSGRYTARDLARNYLECCEPNAILFTHADNDTYPLWYCQEVEGIRRDVRIIVMPYLNAGWYLGQLRRQIHDNPGVKFSIPYDKYHSGELDYLPVVPRIKTEQEIQKVLSFVASDSSQAKVSTQSGEKLSFIPVDKISLSVDDKTVPITIKKDYLIRSDLAFWDIIATNINNRPIYFTSFADPRQYGLENYLRYDGLVYKLISEETEGSSLLEMGKVDTDILYENLMVKCTWENQKDSTVYFDWHHRRMFAVTQMRGAFYRLADGLIQEGKVDQAKEVIGEIREILPFDLWNVDYQSILLAELYFKIGDLEDGNVFSKEIKTRLEEWIDYLGDFEGVKAKAVNQDLQMKLYLYQSLKELMIKYDQEIGNAMNQKFIEYLQLLQS